MNIYMVLFFLGFMLAIGLLAYASMQVEKLNRKAEQFSKDLMERYSKPLKNFDDSESEKELAKLEDNTEKKEEENKEAVPPVENKK
jgi:predicted Holliday junction resolvase-like endonuclease